MKEAVHTVCEMCNLGLDVAIAGGIHYDILPSSAASQFMGSWSAAAFTAQANPLKAAQKISECVQIWPV